MQYTVVHSTDPYLLARLATDLQMDGIKVSKFTSDTDWCHPWGRTGFGWLYFKDPECKKIDFGFANHDCSCTPGAIRHELTSSNYIKVLTQILS